MAGYDTTATVWDYWSTSGTTTSSTTDIWCGWTDATSTSTTTYATTANVWETWAPQRVSSGGYHRGYTAPSQEEINERQRQRKKLEKEREQKRIAAKKRAKQLLYAVIRKDQQKQLEKHGYFEVLSQFGNIYQIHNHGTVANVIAVDFKKRKKRQKLCAHPRNHVANGTLPQEDVMLSQMLALQHDEEAFLARANLH